MFIQFIEPIDDLNEIEWRFWYLDRDHTLYLDNWDRNQRPSKRHKFKPVQWYSRGSNPRSAFDPPGRIDTAPEIPDHIEAKAIEMFMDSLRVDIWVGR